MTAVIKSGRQVLRQEGTVQVPGDEVPGPLPLLGAGAAFGYSRKLRRRLNANAVIN